RFLFTNGGGKLPAVL
ncbi:hypothetical protein L195_g063473, partial [Trifolium pratense]